MTERPADLPSPDPYASPRSKANPGAISPPPAQSNRFAFSTVTALFFMWGFITCMNDLLIPKFKADFQLNQLQANLVQFSFFGAYFIVSLIYFLISTTSGDPINKIGYKNGLVAGLAVAGVGCLLFYPAAVTKAYPLFLGAELVLGAGVTIIQIAANPFVSILGPEESAPARLNLSQGLNSLGYVVAPLVGGLMLFGSNVYKTTGGVDAVKTPYVGLGIAFIALAAVFMMIRLPSFKQDEAVQARVSPFAFPHFFWGWLAIFFYVGSEVTVGSIIINYLKEVNGLGEESSAHFLSFYWGGTMIGRLMGAISLSDIQSAKKWAFMALAAIVGTGVIYLNATYKEFYTHGHHIDVKDITPYFAMVAASFLFFAMGQSKPGRMVGLFATVAFALTLSAMFSKGSVALWSIIGIGLFNSIMWSNIFTLSIRGLGAAKSRGSSLLVMMIVGGAVMPAIQGALTDVQSVGIKGSLAIVLLGYGYLLYFGFFGSRSRTPLTEDESERSMVGGH